MSDEQSDLIAIVAMTGRFPGASSVEQLWEHLAAGRETVTFYPEQALRDAGVDEALLRDPAYVRARGVVARVEDFDPAFFGMSPREASYTDPQQRLFLECAWQLIERAGYDLACFAGSVGVYAGAAISSYLLNNLWGHARGAGGSLDPFHLVLANDKDHLTTRVAYKLGLQGPCVTVQTGCSTSLVAVHMACQALLSRECDMAIAGGVALNIPQATGYRYEPDSKSSPDGHTRTFDAAARGTVQSEGVALVLVKRLDDAVRDGDTIYAVVRGTATNNDGAAKVSYTAPSVGGQADVIRTAQLLAGVSADSIEYVECHGTATAMGDPIEVAALTQAFRATTARTQFCAVGSIKSNAGHMDTAAGAAGLIKAALALHHEAIPPSLHFATPNPEIDFAASPFFVATEHRAWPRREASPRRAAVSSFGVGGTNAHVILEEAPVVAASDPSPRWQLLLVSARSEAALGRATEALRAHLAQHPELPLADVAYTLQAGRVPFAHRRAVVCADTADAIAALGALSPQRAFTRHSPNERPVAFLFPGQGPAYAGMGAALYAREPVFRAAIDRCAALAAPHLGRDLAATFASPAAVAADAEAQVAQPVLFAFEYALAQLWRSWGVQPRAYLGHSMGEYVAATLAGVFELADAMRVIVLRDRLIQNLAPGAILTVLLGADEALPALAADVAITAYNGPGIYSISGPAAAIDALAGELAARGTVHSRLAVSHVSHCPIVEPIVDELRAILAPVALRAPTTPYLSNLTGRWITAAEATDPEYWVRHLRAPVRFSEGVDQLLGDESWILLEVGPGRTLASLIHPHDRGADQVVLASLPQPQAHQHEVELVLQALGKLWGAGGQIDRTALHGGARRRRVVLPTYAFEHQRCWIEPAARAATHAPAPVIELAAARAEPRVAPDPAVELTAAQEVIAELWTELLGVPRVALHADFFDLGGNSLLGIQLHTRIKEQFDVDLSLKALLERSTVAGMAALVERIILDELEPDQADQEGVAS